jgi:hypothetical protein
MVDNNPYIAIGYGTTMARLFYKDKTFFCGTMNQLTYTPYACSTVDMMVDYLLYTFGNTQSEIELMFHYPSTLSKRKKTKTKSLVGISECQKDRLIKWVTLLI